MAAYLIQLLDKESTYLDPNCWLQVAAETPERAAANAVLYFSLTMGPVDMPAKVAVALASGPKHRNGAPIYAPEITVNVMPEGKAKRAD